MAEKWVSPKFGSHRYLAPCGTLAAYQRHVRRKESRDFLCRVARAQASQEWRDKVKERKRDGQQA